MIYLYTIIIIFVIVLIISVLKGKGFTLEEDDD